MSWAKRIFIPAFLFAFLGGCSGGSDKIVSAKETISPPSPSAGQGMKIRGLAKGTPPAK